MHEKKIKRYGTIAVSNGNTEPERRNKLKIMLWTIIKDGLEYHLELVIEIWTKSNGTSWACEELDRKLLVSFHQMEHVIK